MSLRTTSRRFKTRAADKMTHQIDAEVRCDVLVIGTGAAGLSAAVTARHQGLDIIVVEKERHFGGTSAWSGGWLWIPGNPIGKRAGKQDSIDDARTYIRHQTGDLFDGEKTDAYLLYGPQMVRFFEEKTEVKFTVDLDYSDYHPNAPGASTGRSINALPYDGRNLGSTLDHLKPQMPELTLWGLKIGSGSDIKHFFNFTRSFQSFLFVLKHLIRHLRDVTFYGRVLRLVNGNALIARLAKSAMDLKIPIWLSTPAQELLTTDGKVSGALVFKDGKLTRITATRGVILACGGFSRDNVRRAQLYPLSRSQATRVPLTGGAIGTTGDGLRMAEGVGAQIDKDFWSAGYMIPLSRVAIKNGASSVYMHATDRGKPGIIAVTREGGRFVNESDPYPIVAQAICRATSENFSDTVYLICDHRAIRRYGLGHAKPFPIPLKPFLRSGYLMRGKTIEELAYNAGINAEALKKTVENFSRHAREARDPDFGKGSTKYNWFQGDLMHRPNPCLAPIDKPPYYAVKIHPGDLATLAGLTTNQHAQVLGEDRHPISGLYAVGNDMANFMKGHVLGAGTTLGPAMTFGYIAGLHVGHQSRNEKPECE